jgi:hypothetical protein
MSSTRKRVVTGLAVTFVVAAVVAPSAGARVDISAGSPNTPSRGLSERTATELGQSTNLGGNLSERTATELAQSTNLAPSPAPSGESSGFDWDDAAIVGGVLGLALIGLGGVVAFTRRRGRIQRSRTPVVSS